MSSTSGDTAVLYPEDRHNLSRQGLLIIHNGLTNLHKRRMSPWSDEENQDLLLPRSPSPPSSVVLKDFVTIPDIMISRNSLLFLGFTENAATTIWNRWLALGNELERQSYSFESFFFQYIAGTAADAWSENDQEWRGTMHTIGIRTGLQDRLLTPSCKPIRLTKTCKSWLREYVAAKWHSLMQIQAYSRERAMATSRAAGRAEGSSSGQSLQLPGQSSGPSEDSSGLSELRSTSGTLYSSGPSSIEATEPEVRSTAPGKTVLFRGGFLHHFEIFDEAGNADKSKAENLQDPKGGDFNGTKNAAYFAVDWDVAAQYARFCKITDENLAVGILRMEVRNAHIEGLDENEKLVIDGLPRCGRR